MGRRRLGLGGVELGLLDEPLLRFGEADLPLLLGHVETDVEDAVADIDLPIVSDFS